MKKRSLSATGEYASRIAMILVGIACLILSVFYSRQFYITEFAKGPVVATLLAAVIAVFNAFSLTAATYLVKHKQKLMAVLFIPIAIATIAFDVFTIVGAQSSAYISNDAAIEQVTSANTAADTMGDQLKAALDQANLVVTQDMSSVSSAQKALNDATTAYNTQNAKVQDLNDARNKIASAAAAKGVDRNTDQSYTVAYNAYSSANNQLIAMRTAMNTAQSNLDAANKQLSDDRASAKSASDAYTNYLSQKATIVTGNNETTKSSSTIGTTFANWLSSVLTFIPKKWIEFILVLIPALFIDLISPIAMNFGMTLNKIDEGTYDPMEDEDVKAKFDEYEATIKQLKDEADVSIESARAASAEDVAAMKEKFDADVEALNKIVEEKNGEIDEANKKISKLSKQAKKAKERPAKKVEPKIVEPEKPEVVEPEAPVEVAPIVLDIPEPKKEEPKPVVTPHIEAIREIVASDEEGEQASYRFGTTTAKVAEKLNEFIRVCVDKKGKFRFSPDAAGKQLNLSRSAIATFINRLSRLTLNGTPLIVENKDGSYRANFDGTQIAEYATEKTS